MNFKNCPVCHTPLEITQTASAYDGDDQRARCTNCQIELDRTDWEGMRAVAKLLIEQFYKQQESCFQMIGYCDECSFRGNCWHKTKASNEAYLKEKFGGQA